MIKLWLLRYLERYVRRRFHNFRLLGTTGNQLAQVPAGPLIVVLNHSSWWDPLSCLLLARRMGTRLHRAPMDAAQLQKFPFFRSLGMLALTPGEFGSVRRFAASARNLLLRPGGTLWITPQGRFVDPREEVSVARAFPTLLRLLPPVPVWSLALEYSFWNEPQPQIFASLRPLQGDLAREMTVHSRQLAEAVAARNSEHWHPLWPDPAPRIHPVMDWLSRWI